MIWFVIGYAVFNIFMFWFLYHQHEKSFLDGYNLGRKHGGSE